MNEDKSIYHSRSLLNVLKVNSCGSSQVLDLSYNNVSVADIVCLGRLAGLKVLCLTGNRLHQLPADMAGSDRRPAPPT